MKEEQRDYDCNTVNKIVTLRIAVLEHNGKVMREGLKNCNHASTCGVKDQSGGFEWNRCEHPLAGD